MIIKCVRRTISSGAEPFLPLEIRGLTDVRALTRRNRPIDERKEPLHRKFSEKIDWTNIWPAASTFHYSVIPFPIRQGYCKNLQENLGISPGSYANAELLKIPNFLHLTKHHIQKHCAAIKKFCTKWPTGLNSEEAVTKHYPLEVVHQNFVFSAPSIRDPRARLVSIRVAVSSLRLNDHSKRKLIRLAMGPGPGKNFAQYDWSTDILQLSSSRCPTSRQNTDYLRYVLTVLTLESKKTEKWETDSPDYDWLHFDWLKSESRRRLTEALGASIAEEGAKNEKTLNDLLTKLDDHPIVRQYREALRSVWSDNDLLNGNQWVERPKQPRYRHQPFPDIDNVPFLPIPGADRIHRLRHYAVATRQLVGLSPHPFPTSR